MIPCTYLKVQYTLAIFLLEFKHPGERECVCLGPSYFRSICHALNTVRMLTNQNEFITGSINFRVNFADFFLVVTVFLC